MQLGCHPVAAVQYTFRHKKNTEQHKNFGIVLLIKYYGFPPPKKKFSKDNITATTDVGRSKIEVTEEKR
jgi:hypothetical protein